MFRTVVSILTDDKLHTISTMRLSVLQVRSSIPLARVVQTLDRAIHRINHYPADSVIDLRNTYPLDSDLSGG